MENNLENISRNVWKDIANITLNKEESEKRKNIFDDKEFVLIKKISDIDKYNFYEYLSVMLDSWIWMWSSIESVKDKIENLYFRQKIDELLLFVSSWDSLSRAMKKNPLVFTPHEISVVEAWESTWTLAISLESLSEDIKKTYDLKKKIKTSLTYPLIIFIFLIVAIIIVLTYVIPSLLPLFKNSWADLPWITQSLISTSNFVSNNFLIIFFVTFSVFVFFAIYKSTENWKEKIDNFILRLPLVWDVYKNYILANISLTMWNLIGAWVPVMKVLKLVWKTGGSFVYEKIFSLVIKKVERWEKIVESMREVDPEKFYFPSIFIQMLSVWEKTANIEKITKKINKQYTREVEYSLANLTKWIEPLAIFLASIFVVWFVFAIFSAIMQITEAVWT